MLRILVVYKIDSCKICNAIIDNCTLLFQVKELCSKTFEFMAEQRLLSFICLTAKTACNIAQVLAKL